MKGFQKLTLAAAIAAAPFAQAMEAMDDSLLSEMTGQAGITIDVDLQMSIDAIKYVDSDGNQVVTANGGGTGDRNADGTVAAGDGDYDYVSGAQGALTMRGLTVGSDGGAAHLRGITIDVDGTDGLVIGIAEVGKWVAETGSVGTGDLVAAHVEGVDVKVDSIQLHNGDAQGTLKADATAVAAGTAVYDAGVALATAVATGGDVATAQTTLDNAKLAYGAVAQGLGVGSGNIGGLVIDDFRNYVEDSFVSTYNGRFDTALNEVGDAADPGGYIAAEIKINGTGDALLGTGGLSIEAQVGGLMSKAALTMGEDTDSNGVADKVHEFGVKDLAFFGTADSDGDLITDTITAMKVHVDINVVDHVGHEGFTVAALKLSNMSLEGSIVMGDIYLGTQGASNDRSLGSVLIKDIDMTGTEVFIYGH